MRKFKFYSLLLVIMLLSVMLLSGSGCGGSASSGDSSSETDSGTDDGSSTQNIADTYDVAEILNARWIVLTDSTGSGSASTEGGTTYSWKIADAHIKFSNIVINGDTGLAVINSEFIWFVFYGSASLDDREYITHTNQEVEMIHEASNRWRFRYEDSENKEHNIIVEVKDEKTINLHEYGRIEKSNYECNYFDVELDLRKDE